MQYTLTIAADDGTSRTVDVTAAVTGLIGAVESYYAYWAEATADNDGDPEAGMEDFTSTYARAECEEAGYDAAQEFVAVAELIEIPDLYAGTPTE